MEAVHRPAVVRVNLAAIQHNLRQIQLRHPRQQIYAVVKANAYGHGAIEVARAALSAGATGLCVAVLDEAIELRQAGITTPIMVLGVTQPKWVSIAQQEQIELTVPSLEWLDEAIDYINQNDSSMPLKIHLAMDTGMGRIGFRYLKEWSSIRNRLVNSKQVKLVGVFTHFATADSEDTKQANEQNERFKAMKQLIQQDDLFDAHDVLFHTNNSAASLWHPDFETDVIRLGIGLYGYNPSNGELPLPYQLQPALSLETEIAYIKQTQSGDTISYGAEYASDQPEWIATLPVGYADGYLREYKKGHVLIDGMRCPIVGRICMDQLMIKLPQPLPVGTPVVLIGESQGETVSAIDLSHLSDTIAYEVLTVLGSRLPRVYEMNNY
ncbi:alanine racemase [Atopobacter phocae]|uniref:alanine racemase n=1 Tax=Atopobacter phocae TaxID=136492 RepID=UPI00046F7637|nr:alanine racemase [Atopobacter phocae]